MNRLPVSPKRRAARARALAISQRQSLPVGRLLLLLLAALLALLVTANVLAQEDGEAEDQQEGGYTYTVQPGDYWASVAARVGLTEEELKAANPQAIRPSGWLINGERLFIPIAEPVEETFYEVQSGEGWTTVAEQFDIPVRLLQAANPRFLRAGDVLYVGDRLLIPAQAAAQSTPGTATATATAEATEEPTAEPTEEPVEEATATSVPTQEPTEEPTAEPTAEPTEEPTPEPTVEPTEEPTPDPVSLLPECPATFEEYPTAILAALGSGPSGRDLLIAYLETCGIDETAALTPLALAEGVEDLVLTYERSEADERSTVARRSELLIITGSAEDGYAIGFTAYAAGSVTLLATEDINDDSQPDVAWIDTTCGASTCFDTVYMRSWDGSSWRDWTEGTVTMAEAEITLGDFDETVPGQEIQLTGGQYGSFGAGPQRVRSELWGSVDGGAYTLLSESFESSECLYHTILDANQAFNAADFASAQTLYETAVGDESLTACWTRPAELDELRSFAWYRLALLSAYQGDADTAEALIGQLTDSYPSMPYAAIGQRWLDAYLSSGDVKAACALINDYAAGEGAVAVEMLADYGYANPSFTAGDVCPILAVDAPTIEPRVDASAEATVTVTEEPAAEATATEEPVAEEATSEATPAAAAEATSEPAPELALTEELPACPTAVADYGDTLTAVLEQTDDMLVVETWLRLCDALTDDRGGLVVFDLNEDGQDDLLAFPTIVSDAGYGPGGADGVLVIFNVDEEGRYNSVFNEEVYGKPTPLLVGDANSDGQVELIWQVESCSTFCVTGVQSLSWDEESGAYVPGVFPGAAVANGEVFIEPVADDAPGTGRQIRLVGGLSGTPGGGLEVAHEEIWQSIDGAPFRRIAWTYDREAENNDCLGLRLVEADYAMQAADILGYSLAIDLYSQALADAELRACSIFAMEEDDELALLRGLASFRLMQAQVYSDNAEAAAATLADLSAAQPDAGYTTVAGDWLASYQADGDAAAACEAVLDIFEVDADMWQVTDQYGYNHPVLAAEQICFIPAE